MRPVLLLSLLLFVFACKRENIAPELSFQKPGHFPATVYNLNRNPVTWEGFELGRKLFYDGLLSRDGTISCGSCHAASAAFTHHGHDLSHGIDDLLTLRNSLPIMNLAWQREFFRDGGVSDLDLFAIAPIEAHNEMDESLANVLRKLKEHDNYPILFEKAFGSREITKVNFLKALSQFQLMLVSAESKYDQYIMGKATLTDNETEGKKIFDDKCSKCHSGILFTDLSYRNNGLPIKRLIINGVDTMDKGRMHITLNPDDMYKFKVPGLRNLRYTQPYMHDGRFRSLRQVLDHYSDGIELSPTLDPLLIKNGQLGIPLTEDEKDRLIDFLNTLNDENFINNPLFQEY